LLPHGRAEQIVGNEWQEHAVPCAFLQRKASELLRHGIPPDSVARWIEPYLRIVTIEKSDAQQLDGPLGLKDVMPEGWRFGGDCMYARLHAQGIRFTAPVEGPACHCAFHSAVRTALGEQNLDRSGATLYSSVETLQPGAVYLLGTNPGGRDEGKRLLRESYLHLPRGAQNAYYDEEWDSKSQQLQKQVQALLRAVAPGAERKVCASNLIFFRSRNQDELPTFWPDAKTCWPVHEHVLNTVMPSIVIAFGNSPESAYGFLKETLPRHGIVDLFRTGHGNTWCEGFRTMWAGKPMFVAGLPHLSRFSLTDEGELRPLIGRWLQHRTSDAAGEPPQFLINGGPAEPPQK
jgi:hypothetical protein